MTRSPLTWIAAAALGAAAAAPGASPSRPTRQLVSVSATPGHVRIVGRGSQKLVLHNDGRTRVRVVARPSSFTFDPYGDANIGPRTAPPRSAHTWLVVRPRQLVLAPRRKGVLHLSVRVPRHAKAGDHHALVLLSVRTPRRAHVSIRTRLGVIVLVRVPGRVVRRLGIGRMWVARGRRRSIVVSVLNRGNVAERLQRGQLTIAFHQQGTVLSVARGRSRDLLPGTRGLVVAPVSRSLRGFFTAVVRIGAQPGWTVGPSAPPLLSARRAFTLRL